MLTVKDSLFGSAMVLLGLAFLATVVALVPRWRKRWGWGRTGNAGPISGVGWAGIILGLLIMGAGVGTANRGWFDSFFSLLLVLGGFALFIAAGLYDSVRNGRAKREKGPGQSRAPRG